MNTVKIYVELLEEGTDTWRPTQAISIGNDTYKILPTEQYDPEDEIWAFLPGTVVKAKKGQDEHGKEILVAIERVE